MRQLVILGCAMVSTLVGTETVCEASPPIVFHQPSFQSPVHADPDDLMLIPGYGFDRGDRVVYRLLTGDSAAPPHPATVPEEASALAGSVPIVSLQNLPHSLTVRLPASMLVERPYVLWVVNASGEWSEPFRINDPRPLWISPAVVFASAPIASLPRYLKVIGRNLEPWGGMSTDVELAGPDRLVLHAEPSDVAAQSLNEFVARVKLPVGLSVGEYRVRVRRAGSAWTALAGQRLVVRADPPRAARFQVGDARFGDCAADRAADAAPCLLRAMDAARAAGGGTVVFGPGTWHLSERHLTQPNGIVIPHGVNLQGAGAAQTTIIQDADGPDLPDRSSFTLLGGNVVEGITFRDAHLYTPQSRRSTFLKLGMTLGEGALTPRNPVEPVSDVVITHNVFDRPNVAISAGGEPILRLYVTYNEIGAYKLGVDLSAAGALVNVTFDIVDSVIDHNLFEPGSYLATPIYQGAMASEIGASRRLDFSNNFADGTATRFMYSATDARGWRAAFFWHMDNSQEMMLVAQNRATCTGDKDGTGEAISYDDNHNTFALAAPAVVLDSAADAVTIGAPLARRQHDRDILINDYYVGHWIQVVDGPGLGQVRRIRDYQEDSGTGTTRFSVSPAWDVVPAPGATRIGIGREYWQVYTVANTVDHRQPMCLKTNRTGKQGGTIDLWAQTADSVVEGNRQYDTDGIIVRLHYDAEEDHCPDCNRETSYVDFLEVRGNLIDGEYDWSDDCSSSGIFVSLAAGPTIHTRPPVVGYGLSVSHNTIERADGRTGGAISLTQTWYAGPPPNRWPVAENVLIHHNLLLGLDAPPARACTGNDPHPRTAISLGDSELVSGTALYANQCPGANRAWSGRDRSLVRVCAAAGTDTCECPHVGDPQGANRE